jgi:hypothetical protein
MRVFLAVLLLAGLGACAPATRLVVLDPTPRPARAAEEVEVLRAVPERAHEVIAEWRSEKESVFDERRTLRNRARRQAAALGADAIVVTFREEIGSPVRAPSMLPGVATEPGETTIPTTNTRVVAQLIVWR